MRATRGYSTIEEQKRIFSIGRDSEGKIVDHNAIVTHAKPGNSYHNYSLAVDSCFYGTDPYWETLNLKDPGEFNRIWGVFGTACQRNGLTWGGSFHTIVDRPHAQISYGLSIPELKAIYSARGLDGVWRECDTRRSLDRSQAV